MAKTEFPRQRPGSSPGQGTRSHLPQLRSGAAKYRKINFKKKKIGEQRLPNSHDHCPGDSGTEVK